MSKKILLQELAEKLAQRENLPKKNAEQFLRVFFQTIEQSLNGDKLIKIKGWGTFRITLVDKRESVDVNSGERIEIKSHARITFSPENTLKDELNQPFAHFQTIILNEGVEAEAFEAVDQEWNNYEAVQADMPEEDEEEAETVEEQLTTVGNEDEQVAETDIKEPREEQNDFVMPAPNAAITPEEKAESVHTDSDLSDDAPPPSVNQAITDNSEAITSQKDALSSSYINESAQTVSAASEDSQTSQKAHQEEEGKALQTENEKEQEKELPPLTKKKTNWWKIIAITLFSLLLLTLSYFAGYFRILCPCEFEQWFSIAQEHAPSVVTTSPKEMPEEPEPSQQTPEVVLSPQHMSEPPADRLDTTTVPIEEVKPIKTKQPQTSSALQQQYRQVEGGKYKIVGTLRKHTIKEGETLRTIALTVYGSKGYVPYIITHNDIKNPDLVERGMILKLPKLEKQP